MSTKTDVEFIFLSNTITIFARFRKKSDLPNAHCFSQILIFIQSLTVFWRLLLNMEDLYFFKIILKYASIVEVCPHYTNQNF